MFRPVSVTRSQRRVLLTLLPLALALVIAHPGQAESPREGLVALCPVDSPPNALGLTAASLHRLALLETHPTQNLAWFGLLPLEVSPERIQVQRQRQRLAA